MAAEVIQDLTPEQDAKLESYYEKWLAVGLQTGPRDHKAIEAALRKIYECAGLKPPARFVWGPSPVAVARMVDTEGGKEFGDPGRACYGTHDAGWLGFYDFMRTELGLVEETNELVGLTEAAQAGTGWFWPFEEVCFVSELPTVISQDAEGRLHAESGPALAYSDGTEVYAWHDVNVPKDVILNPKGITTAQIDGEQNAEIRRVMIERYGQERYIKDSDLKPVQEDEAGMLFRKELPGDEPLVMVRVIDTTTGKPYFLRVPPEMTTAKEAVAWTFDVKPDEYKPEAET